MRRLFSIAFCSALCLACQDGCGNRDAPAGQAGGARALPSTPEPIVPPKVVLMLYVVGGHLEDSVLVRGEWGSDEGYEETPLHSPFGAASDDLREIARGFDALSNDARQNLHGWVAFGGARKQGWQGMRVADLACLSADAEDGVFGNADCYAFADAEANMMKPQTLVQFLNRAPQQPALPDSKPPLRVLALWGQGGGFRGLFHDSKREMPFMKLSELGQALIAAEARFDLAILDCPMMATAEVAQTLAPFARFLVASVDTIPAHGFDYRALVSDLARVPEKQTLEVARSIADRYLDGSSLVLERSDRKLRELSHKETSGKTISVLDLTRTNELLSALDRFSKVANTDLPKFGPALARATSYGRNLRWNSLYTVDLETLATEAKAHGSSFSKPADELLMAVSRMVSLVRDDGTKPSSGGLSVFSPLAALLWAGYEQEAIAAPGWLALSHGYAGLREKDPDPPTLLRHQATKALLELEAKDASGVLSAETWHMVSAPGSAVFGIFQTSAATLEKSSGAERVSAGPWDGRGHFLCSGPCQADNRTAIPAHLEGSLDDGSRLYSTSVVVRDAERGSEGEEGVLFFRALPEKAISDAWVVHTETDTNGEVLFFRDHYRLEQGLSVAFHVFEYDKARGSKSTVTDFFELRSAPQYELAPLATEPERLRRALAVRDVAGNLAVSDLVPLRGSR